MDPKSTLIIRTLRGLPSNAAILSTRAVMSFEDGTPANFKNGIYLHHFLIADLSKPNAPFALCPNRHQENKLGLWLSGYALEATGAGLLSVGNDAYEEANIYMNTKNQVKSAFLTMSDDLFGVSAEIVNYNKDNRTVYLDIELEYFDHKPDGYLDAANVVVSATGCELPGYRPPNNERKFTYVSEPFFMEQDGWIVNARGHLHDGGSALEIYKNNKLACQSLPTYGREPGANPDVPETIISMSWCHDAIRFFKGDNLTIKSHYDVDAHPLRSAVGEGHHHGGGGGMAGMGGMGGMGGMPGMSAASEGAKKPGWRNNKGSEGEQSGGMEEMGIMTTNFAWDVPPLRADELGNAGMGNRGLGALGGAYGQQQQQQQRNGGAVGRDEWGKVVDNEVPTWMQSLAGLFGMGKDDD